MTQIKALQVITIGKNWIILTATVLLAVGLFLIVYFWPLFSGEPKLRLEFFPPPPWKVKAGDTLKVTVGIPNDGRGTARSVHLSLLVPEGFTGFIIGTNEREIIIGTIHGGDGKASAFVIAVSSRVSPGNYSITVKLWGENVPEQVFTPVIEVHSVASQLSKLQTFARLLNLRPITAILPSAYPFR